MVSLEEDGRLIVLEEGDRFYSSLVEFDIFNGKKVLLPNVIDAVVLIESKGKYYFATFNGKWNFKEIKKLEPLNVILTIPLTYSKPKVLCKGVFCPDIKVMVDEENYLVYPCLLSSTILVRAEGEKDYLLYAFIPDIGWIKV